MNNPVEDEPGTGAILYSDLPQYLSDEQKRDFEFLPPEQVAKLEETHPYWSQGLKRYEAITARRKDINLADERERKRFDDRYVNTRLRQFLAGSSRSLEDWVKMDSDSPDGAYKRFISESLENPKKYLLTDEIRQIDRIMELRRTNRPAA